MSQQKQSCADVVQQADLPIGHDLHVGFGSGEAQLNQLLLEGGVHVHSIRLLTLCLHSRQQNTVKHGIDALYVKGSIGLLTLCLQPRQHQVVNDNNDALQVWAEFSWVFPPAKSLLLEGGVHVHSICLLTLCLHAESADNQS